MSGLRRFRPLVWLAPVAALAAVLTGPYLGVRQVAEADGADAFIYDASYYVGAAERPPAALYADPEYVYPPPSRAVVAPFGWLGLQATLGVWIALNALLLGGAAGLAVRLWERAHERLPTAVRWALVAVAVGSGPAFQTLKYGQVNALVLWSGIGFLWLLARGRPGWAVVALCGGFWLKLYPILLLPLALARDTWRRAAAGLAVGIAGIPLALAPWIPLRLYAEFFGERLPAWSGLTSQGALNQSVVGVATRLTLPTEAALRALDVPAPTWARGLALLVLAVGGGAVVLAVWAGRLERTRGGVLLLALVPVVSPLGWEHAYVLGLPLLLWALVEVREHSGAVPVVTAAAVLLMVPRPPARVLIWWVETVPAALVHALNARMLLATVVLGVLVARWCPRPAARALP